MNYLSIQKTGIARTANYHAPKLQVKGNFYIMIIKRSLVYIEYTWISFARYLRYTKLVACKCIYQVTYLIELG